MRPIDRREKVVASPALDRRFRTHLRLAEADNGDAEYICKLRGDPDLNRHLNAGSPEVHAQLDWLKQYKGRERDGQEFYFVIVSDRRPAGLVRMYDFRFIDGRSSFSWGSWIIPAPRAAGLVTYSALLMYELGFDVLKFDHAHFDVRVGNTGVIAFHERVGARRVRATEQDVSFNFSPEAYATFKATSARQIAEHRIGE